MKIDRLNVIRLASILDVVGGVLFLAGARAGLGICGLAMVASGALGIGDRRISFRKRGRSESYEGSEAVIMGAMGILVGLGLVLWSATQLLSGSESRDPRAQLSPPPNAMRR